MGIIMYPKMLSKYWENGESELGGPGFPYIIRALLMCRMRLLLEFHTKANK